MHIQVGLTNLRDYIVFCCCISRQGGTETYHVKVNSQQSAKVSGIQTGYADHPCAFWKSLGCGCACLCGQSHRLGQAGGGVCTGPFFLFYISNAGRQKQPKQLSGSQPRSWATGKVLQQPPCIIGLDQAELALFLRK